MSEIKVLVVPVDGRPHIAEVMNDIRTFQTWVDGYVETVVRNGHYALVDEEGRQKRKATNVVATTLLGLPVVGQVVFVSDQGSEWGDVPDQTVRQALAFSKPDVDSFKDPIAAAILTLKEAGYQVIEPKPASQPRVRRDAPDTSKAIEPKLGTQMASVLEFIRVHQPCADDEIEQWLNISHQSASAARRNLVLRGAVVDSGLRHRTRYGNKAIAWVTPDRYAEFAPQAAL